MGIKLCDFKLQMFKALKIEKLARFFLTLFLTIK